MRTDERTDMTKLIVSFHNFANASEKKRLDADYVKPATGYLEKGLKDRFILESEINIIFTWAFQKRKQSIDFVVYVRCL
jgi:hypothetical protein